MKGKTVRLVIFQRSVINTELKDGLDLGFTSGCTSTNPKSYYECVSLDQWSHLDVFGCKEMEACGKFSQKEMQGCGFFYLSNGGALNERLYA